MARPLIGVSGPDKGGAGMWFFTWLAVVLAGGWAVRLHPANPRSDRKLHGLVITGGADVAASLYEERSDTPLDDLDAAEPETMHYLVGLVWYPLVATIRWALSSRKKETVSGDTARDKLEYALLQRAMDEDLPVLGICRGMQLLNVFFGGSLHKSIAEFYMEEPQVRSVLPRKLVYLEKNSRLRSVFRRNKLRVNALHDQAVNELGAGLRVAGRELNDVVQAIEHADLEYVVGVQWHPEFLQQKKEQRRLFRALVRAARARRQRGKAPARQ
ncbi:gamma-glutamyl-gamma-aminobutyrate hydrolase family protein [Oceanidesulfovibrio indonesiensis]|uniref:Gamma-glutamyl-gamma-aminobutyrate hydrolase family protein n=1 Tax=Oceanidesulfovibrio indonesiensis TaxID=54767 RepID=A0A7M3MI21_9BACT|nr:gamma-glutamyl-gamma-aminobutyrate hydrolase family protein [Oceanidesulfovibrio indonesiensis]TVM18818.1 gamma-glutamyl-gamma-aminobutyrate hydrolase family protein [Oceanidesulfovibrio indonesiensis]